jgi:putative transcriptional regulator
MKKPHFATRLQELREEAGLSAYALAQRAGVSRQAISRLESGENQPSWEMVQKLALALTLSTDSFVDPSIHAVNVQPAKVGRPRKETAPKKGKGRGKA